jgi:nitroreductase
MLNPNIEHQEPKIVAILEPIAQRQSPKGFLDRPIAPEKLRSLFEAARWAPSSRNEQPWRFVVAAKENATQFADMLSTLNPMNVEWAQHAHVLVSVIAKRSFDRDGKENRHANYDVGGAVATLTLQAVSLGIQVHQMGGFDGAKVRALFSIPSEFDPIVILAVGYADELQLLQKRRARKELGELVFEHEWTKAAHVVEQSKKEDR